MESIKYVSREQVRQFLDRVAKVSIRDHAIFTVMYWRGLRASEVGLIMMEDWSPASNRLYVHRVKNSNSGEYVVSQEERKVIGRWIDVRGRRPGPIFLSRRNVGVDRRSLDRIIRTHSDGIWPDDRRHCHTLRHSIAIHLLEQGVELLAVKDWLGHKSIMSTMEYAKVTNPVRRRAEEIAYSHEQEPAPADKPPAKAEKVNWKKDRR